MHVHTYVRMCVRTSVRVAPVLCGVGGTGGVQVPVHTNSGAS